MEVQFHSSLRICRRAVKRSAEIVSIRLRNHTDGATKSRKWLKKTKQGEAILTLRSHVRVTCFPLGDAYICTQYDNE